MLNFVFCFVQFCLFLCPILYFALLSLKLTWSAGSWLPLLTFGSHTKVSVACTVVTWLAQHPISLYSLVYRLLSFIWLAQYAGFTYLHFDISAGILSSQFALGLLSLFVHLQLGPCT